jgi:hypothetical protein
MICNSLWLVVFGRNNSTAFIIAWIIIVGILVTDVIIMMKALRTKQINTIEFLTLRIGFSIYSGWVTAATILNTTIFLKSVGMESNEETWGVIILWVALVVYTLASFNERNFAYGAVFIWVLLAIKGEAEMTLKTEIAEAIPLILYIYIALLFFVAAFCVFIKVKGKCDRGLMY